MCPRNSDVPAKFHNTGSARSDYDSRDSNFTEAGPVPPRLLAELRQALGGDSSFDKVETLYNHYPPLGPTRSWPCVPGCRPRPTARRSSPCPRSTCAASRPTAIATTSRCR
jgi:hypothetical protein